MEYRLSELFELQMGKTPSRNNPLYWDSKDHAWISIADISGLDEKYVAETKEYLSKKAVIESGIKEIPANTVIMSFKLSIGKVAITPAIMYSNEAIMAFIDKGITKIIPDYLYYLFLHKNWDKGTNKAVMGATLNKKVLSDITIRLHTLAEQKRIVEILDKVKGIIKNQKLLLKAHDNLIKARFVEMFGDCKTNPKAWKTVALGEIANVGSSKRVFVEQLKDEGIPFYRGTEVGLLAEGKEINPELYITPEHYAELVSFSGKPSVGDLLMPSICPDGRIWVVNTEKPFYFKDGRVLWVHSICKDYEPVFLLYTLKDRIMTDYNSIASGTTFAELKIFTLKQCHVFNVPIKLQREFVALIRQIDKSKVVNIFCVA